MKFVQEHHVKFWSRMKMPYKISVMQEQVFIYTYEYFTTRLPKSSISFREDSIQNYSSSHNFFRLNRKET